MRLRAPCLALLTALAGCDGRIETGGFPPIGGTGGHSGTGGSTGVGGSNGGVGGGNGGVGGGGEGVVIDKTCDVSLYQTITLPDIEAGFAANVYPKLTNAQTGCVSCHATNSGRQFKVWTGMAGSEAQTFYDARTQRYFEDKAGSLVDRLISADPMAKMPKGLATWEKADIEAVHKIGCQLKAYEQLGGAAADEVFPPNLLTPYAGAPSTIYDNTFLNFPQLKGKVKQVFNDDWLRGTPAVNQFTKNIGLFGGVDFVAQFVEARVATPEFLLGLDALAPDVCGRAQTAKTGPFVGIDTAIGIIDTPAGSTATVEAEAMMPSAGSGQAATGGYLLFTNGTLTTTFNAPGAGSYNITVRAYGSLAGGIGPNMDLIVDGTTVKTWVVSNLAPYAAQPVFTIPNLTAGNHNISIGFSNDATINMADRNLWVDNVVLVGPTGAGTGTARVTLAKASVNKLFQRMLYRSATTPELDAAYALLKDLSVFGTLPDSWTGVCEALVRHPDFLFTLAPSYEIVTPADRAQLMKVKLALDLLGRPPTATELANGKNFEQQLDAWLLTPEFRDYYFSRIQLRTESQATAVTDEPARLWTYIAMNGLPYSELLAGDYIVDATWVKQTRPAYHGKTGMLTMKGFISNKPGLPHYNYAARVLTDFMGYVFEVPQEVFDQRGTATAASTVDATSVCFSCHQNLTPLATQRLAWDDNGDYRTVDDQGAAINDTDRGLVPSYAFKGKGMEAFATQAVKKETFKRRVLNSQYRLLMGREMRHAEDERVIYKQLWDTSLSSNENLKSVIKAIALSNRYQRTP
jgi:hypothetical protein